MNIILFNINIYNGFTTKIRLHNSYLFIICMQTIVEAKTTLGIICPPAIVNGEIQYRTNSKTTT